MGFTMLFYKLARDFVRLILSFRYKLVVTFRQELPEGGFIICANHQSNIDPIMLAGSIKRQIHYMAKAELFKNPILGAILKKAGTFKVSRGEGDVSAIDTAISVVKSGGILGIFPEGTRSHDGKLKRARSGAVVVASTSKGDIMPVGIVYAGNTRFRKIVTVNFGEIIKNDRLEIENNDRSHIKAASKIIMESIAELMIDNEKNGCSNG